MTKPIAIYLPQFHPIPENDIWWGKGFTEWRNVVKAKPRFKGHYQPHLPADLGYYDLRIPEIRKEQAELARKYGIYGFCYYHYWFNGKRLLEHPFEEVFQSGEPDFPFMLCWANENWTRAWDGGEKEILIKQNYSFEDDSKHINALIPYFKDERYIKVNGKPIFIIYNDSLFPDIKKTLEIFRSEALKHGIELYLCKFDRNENISIDHDSFGFDAAIEFQPFARSFSTYNKENSNRFTKYFDQNNYKKFFLSNILQKEFKPKLKNRIIDFNGYIEHDIKFKHNQKKLYPGVTPGWDNSSRRPVNQAMIFKGSTPTLFKKWIMAKLEKFQPFSSEENFLFINAWNEWAEGNHLEPCEKWGHAYLKALKEALNTVKQ
jgi:lipopolysaccharide biosynthesis protein